MKSFQETLWKSKPDGRTWLDWLQVSWNVVFPKILLKFIRSLNEEISISDWSLCYCSMLIVPSQNLFKKIKIYLRNTWILIKNLLLVTWNFKNFPATSGWYYFFREVKISKYFKITITHVWCIFWSIFFFNLI